MKKTELTNNALIVLNRRYLKKDKKGNIIETSEEMFRRVAENIASADKLYNPSANIKKTADDFYELMSSLEFLPNSPTLMNAGRKLQQLAACFVLPVEDSLESIFEAVKNTAIIHQTGGGTGFSFSHLRPKNDIVSTTSGIASGPLSFMRVFNMATEVIKQGGVRRGANMGVLRVDHPDIIEFIDAKTISHELTNFNLSIGITDDFMNCVEIDSKYDLINPRSGEKTGKLKAKGVFERIVQSAWKSGEPGVLFLNRINRNNPTPHLGEMESTNPCGEQPLLPYESCNLGSINLTKMLRKKGSRGQVKIRIKPSNPRTLESFQYEINWEKLRDTVYKAVHFLDNVIDVSNYPLPQIKKMSKGNRKIGLGVMGFADLLIMLSISYNSEEALKIAEGIIKFIRERAEEKSAELAKERGTYPNYKDLSSKGVKECKNSKSSDSLTPELQNSKTPKLHRRNATLITIAPTGTLSIIAGCSSGIEPLYAISYIRRALEDVKLLQINPLFIEIAKTRGFYNKELRKELQKGLNLTSTKEIPDDVKRLFVTSFDISPEWHVKMQATFQKHTDNAVSKTINFPPDAEISDVKNAFLLAHKLGCKGLTIYRSGTRENQVLTCRDIHYC
ncbi:MAG TPA: adenosylcobalamin-dependent ribonucleoside-diphosphate reductase [Nitrospinae bacterium]|nr:adenosylcobalamin-dependent ribonucleoside-diphosphate reductase [Nitrospinota bacterium]HBA25933.1 adenosylcobalamin-dependent ribonucleoside-diphosphate reductase [Nitrospinota bacterium]